MAPITRSDSDASAPTANDDVRQYWDAHPISTDNVEHATGSYESYQALRTSWHATMNQVRLDFLEQCRGKRVLEVGCGIAMDGLFLAENGIDYRGLDLSEASLAIARKHFEFAGLEPNFVWGDARSLPFEDDAFDLVFSIGCLHHSPDTSRSCREVVRVCKPGGSIRVMLYHRASYHYHLVDKVVRPLLWLASGRSPLKRLMPFAPSKIRNMHSICEAHGFDRQRILNISTDTSFAGQGDYNPVSQFFTKDEFKQMFHGMQNCQFMAMDLKYFPLALPKLLRDWVESHFGFFLTMTADKPSP